MHSYRSIAYSRYNEAADVDYSKFASAYRRRLSGRLQVLEDWRCLDIGCGYGNFLGYLRDCGVGQYLGVDSSEAAVSVAKRQFGDEHAVCVDIFEFLSESKGSYRLISALDFVEHLKKDELFQFLELTNKVQTPGEFLLIRTPNANGLFGMAARYNDITHEVCFSTTAIADVLLRGGYQVKSIWEDTGVPRSGMQAVHWSLWQSARFVIRLLNAAETGNWGDGVFTRNMWVLASKS